MSAADCYDNDRLKALSVTAERLRAAYEKDGYVAGPIDWVRLAAVVLGPPPADYRDPRDYIRDELARGVAYVIVPNAIAERLLAADGGIYDSAGPTDRSGEQGTHNSPSAQPYHDGGRSG